MTTMAANGAGHAGFALLLDAAIHHAAPELSARTRDLMVAQAAHESEWGHCTAFLKACNPWNVTAGPSWTGPVVPGPDTERDAAGNVRNITQAWREYASVEAAAVDFLRLLSWPKYSAARALLMAGDMLYVEVLGQRGYYTELPAVYRAACEAALREVEAFTRGNTV